MYSLVNKYGLIGAFGLVVLMLLISFGIYSSQEYIVDPVDGSLRDTEFYGMLDGEVIKKDALEKFDKKRYADNPDENAEIIGNVAPLVNMGYGLFAIGVVAIVAMFVISGVKDPQSIKQPLVFFGVIILLYFISRGVASSEIPENYGVDTTEDLFNLSGGLLTMAYLLAGLAVASVIGGGVLAYTRRS
jgi:hypothetical protein